MSALYMHAAMQLWAGHSPKMFRTAMDNPERAWDLQGILLLLWGAWAATSPGSLRAMMRSIILTRDFLASFRIDDDKSCEWHFK